MKRTSATTSSLKLEIRKRREKILASALLILAHHWYRRSSTCHITQDVVVTELREKIVETGDKETDQVKSAASATKRHITRIAQWYIWQFQISLPLYEVL